jgi:hypothetical protein
MSPAKKKGGDDAVSKRYRKRPHQWKRFWWNHVPRHIWLLGEILALLLALHYFPVPLSELLPLIKLLR